MVALNGTWLQRFPTLGTSVSSLKYDWPSKIGPVGCRVAGCVEEVGQGMGKSQNVGSWGNFLHRLNGNLQDSNPIKYLWHINMLTFTHMFQRTNPRGIYLILDKYLPYFNYL